MRPRSLEPYGLLAWLKAGGDAACAALRAVARHTGLPTAMVVAIALVVSWVVVRRSFALAVRVAVAAALLFAAVHLGWIRW